MMNIHVRCEWLAKFEADCEYGAWSEDRSRRALAVLRALRAAPKVDLAALRG